MISLYKKDYIQGFCFYITDSLILQRKSDQQQRIILVKDKDNHSSTSSCKSLIVFRVCWLENRKAFSVLNCSHFTKVFQQQSQSYDLTLPLTLTTQFRDTSYTSQIPNTQIPAKQEPIDLSLDSEHIQSAVQSSGNEQGCRFSDSRWDNECERVSFTPWPLKKGTIPSNSGFTQTEVLSTEAALLLSAVHTASNQVDTTTASHHSHTQSSMVTRNKPLFLSLR